MIYIYIEYPFALPTGKFIQELNCHSATNCRVFLHNRSMDDYEPHIGKKAKPLYIKRGKKPPPTYCNGQQCTTWIYWFCRQTASLQSTSGDVLQYPE